MFGASLTIVGIIALLCLCYLAGLPSRPDMLTGHVIALNVHGSILFMTKLQQWISQRLLFIGVGLGLLAGIVDQCLNVGAFSKSR